MLKQCDSLQGMNELKSESVDLVLTSPPYAMRRKNTYGGIETSKYVDWFIPYILEMERVTKITGGIFINIKAHTEGGERSTYVYELILEIKKQTKLMFIDEFAWVKNPYPGGYKGRFKNAWESVFHFSRTSTYTFNPLACGTPVKEDTIARAKRKQCSKPKNGSGMAAINVDALLNAYLVRPSNVINVNNISNQFMNRNKHPAPYPIELCNFFIKSFTNRGDVILDPFCGRDRKSVV